MGAVSACRLPAPFGPCQNARNSLRLRAVRCWRPGGAADRPSAETLLGRTGEARTSLHFLKWLGTESNRRHADFQSDTGCYETDREIPPPCTRVSATVVAHSSSHAFRCSHDRKRFPASAFRCTYLTPGPLLRLSRKKANGRGSSEPRPSLVRVSGRPACGRPSVRTRARAGSR